MEDKKYKEICDKLGFIPLEHTPECKAEEDDTWENPFSVLEPEEIMYLFENGYMQ